MIRPRRGNFHSDHVELVICSADFQFSLLVFCIDDSGSGVGDDGGKRCR